MNRTILEKVRCMFHSSGLPKLFWGEAMKIATYLINKCTSSAMNLKTPDFVWNGYNPDYSNLQNFSCAAYAHPDNETDFENQPLEDEVMALPNQDNYQLARDRERRTNIRPPARLAEVDLALALKAQPSFGIEPVSYEKAMKSKDHKFWLAAMQEKMNSLIKNST
ncbi:Integrase catalytic domain-containing protein [Abeliophyllum distichum]|uniref:Integrase catalytic domain-containing protein n=1 Tax=Abeliophyllum distichum TaxID=126358 RepID=A0ABD1PCE5_9LAMI